ncbi:MAG: hypothetical protein ACLQFI_05250 [Methylocella sp.]
MTLVATARETVFDRLDWQLARLRRELETAARFADEGAAIIAELAGYSGSSGRYHISRQGRACLQWRRSWRHLAHDPAKFECQNSGEKEHGQKHGGELPK